MWERVVRSTRYPLVVRLWPRFIYLASQIVPEKSENSDAGEIFAFALHSAFF